MLLLRTATLALLCLVLKPAFAQEKMPVKFGKVTPADFTLPAEGWDSSAAAVIIADFGTSSFEGNVKGWFSLVFKHSRRIKILKHNGFEAATISIPLYVSGNDAEKVDGLRAVTYNLENGKIVETKLDDKSIFTNKVSRNWIEKKFTFPALKEGAIVEYTYTQTSPFLFNLQPWEFQGEYPCLWSEYQTDIPELFQYVTISQGYLPFHLRTTDSRQATFNITEPGGSGRDEHGTFTNNVVTTRLVMKNVPALKEEAFTTTLNNYIAKIEFQLARYNWPNGVSEDRMGNWLSVSKALLKDEDFGTDLDRNNSWLDDDMKTITRGAGSNLDKARKIYAYVRDNFTCTSHSSLYTSNPIKTVFKNRSGNEADLNLLLTAMLRHEKITADPVILSTRAHGFTNSLYPLLNRFNYVVVRAQIDSAVYDMDASEQWLGFGRLPGRCYNGNARLINNDMPNALILSPDSIVESKVSLVLISNDEHGGLVGRLESKPGYIEASDVRQKIQAKGQQEFMKSLRAAYSGEVTLSNLELDSLKQPDMPLDVSYDFHLATDSSSSLFYFNPMLGEGYKENPFKAAERFYPVEMPCAMDETYTLNMDIPAGYVVDELPKSARVAYNDNEGSFEYLVVKDDERIQFRSRVKLNRATFQPEDYASLRDFFGFIVKKQSEQIVFKKKK